MSLIPYHTREGREIVLRHHNAIVVRDPSSRRLEIRGLAECPTCHRPLRSASPERHYEPSVVQQDTYMNPDYFRMLREGSDRDEHQPSSPIRRLVEQSPELEEPTNAIPEAEFVSSTPAVPAGSRIRRRAFSPGYFRDFFVEERELGRGGKGVVLLVRHVLDGCPLGHFACKRVPVGDDHGWLEKVLVEVSLLAKLSHPNLVSYRHVWLEDVTLTRFGPSVACAFILQQYCNGGDLLHYLVGDAANPHETTKEELKAQMRRRLSKGQTDTLPPGPYDMFGSAKQEDAHQLGGRRLSFEEIYSLFRDITSGLAYLHAANYIHRDLKPSNCLLHHEGNKLICLISDFGEVQPENVVRKSTGATGTISYCAPEVLIRDGSGRFGNFTTKSDIFSLGMILYFMCFGRLPYQAANTLQEELEDVDMLRAEITDWKGFHDERRERPDLPSRLYQLLKRLLAVNPLERPSASEVLGAMKSESGHEGVPRGGGGGNSGVSSGSGGSTGRSSSPSAAVSLGIAGRRIQNLDSPVPPSTPVPDPTKHARVTSSSDEDLSTVTTALDDQNATFNQSGIHKHAGPATGARQRHQAHAMSPSHSQDGFSHSQTHHRHQRHPSNSPSRQNPSKQGRGMDIIPFPASPSLSLSHSPSPSRSSSPTSRHYPPLTPTLTTPLLMPPPRTLAGEITHRTALVVHKAGRILTSRDFAFTARLAVFVGKVATLALPCWPYAASWGVGLTLVAVAALDLAVPGTDPTSGSERYEHRQVNGAGHGRRGSRSVVVVQRGGGGGGGGGRDGVGAALDRGNRGQGQYTSGVAANGVEGSGARSSRSNANAGGAGSSRSGWWRWREDPEHEVAWAWAGRQSWDWRASAALLVLHMVFLVVASRAGVLCAAPRRQEWDW